MSAAYFLKVSSLAVPDLRDIFVDQPGRGKGRKQPDAGEHQPVQAARDRFAAAANVLATAADRSGTGLPKTSRKYPLK